MKIANVADLKNRLSEFLALVEQGEEIEIHKRNVPIARVLPITRKRLNKTKLGCGVGTVKLHHDLTEPLIRRSDWNMFKSDKR